jgi:aminopeptidase-like protein
MENIFESDLNKVDFSKIINKAENDLNRLFPLNRSILNQGVIDSLNILKENLNFDVLKIQTGFNCYDWIVPEEWIISDAYIEVGNLKIIDFNNNNLHVLNYSQPIDKEISYEELLPHLYYIKEQPNAIPYRTSYYKKNWGFCLTYNQFLSLDKNARYRVKIVSQFINGNISIAEKVIEGKVKDEILISAYTCHPSMANDSLSGVIVWSMLLNVLQRQKPFYTYRFVLVPETIGAIAYLKLREKEIKTNTKRGFVLTTCGGPGKYGVKSSFIENDLIDDAVKLAFKNNSIDYIYYPFDVNGSDERQYSSPYFRIPCTTITKDKYYEYKEYHTSLDNLSFVRIENLHQTFLLYLHTLQNLELGNKLYLSLNPACEPFLTKRDLYSSIGVTISNKLVNEVHHTKKEYTTFQESKITGEDIDLILWLMFHSDGQNNLFKIAKKINKSIFDLYRVANIMINLNLIKEI